MRRFNNLGEMHAGAPGDVYDHHYKLLKELRDGAKDLNKISFNDNLGGYVWFVETVEEFTRILQNLPKSKEGNIFFEIAEVIPGGFLFLFIAMNDAGGPVYYVPKEVYTVVGEMCPSPTVTIVDSDSSKLLN